MKDTTEEYLVGQVTVGTSAVKVPTTALSDGNRKGILIKAYGDKDTVANVVPIFIGNAQVTVATGFPLGPGESITLPISGDDIYAISANASQTIAWTTL